MPPPLPFPYAIRVGTDICRIARIFRLLCGGHGTRFVHRLLAPEELARMRPAMQKSVAKLATHEYAFAEPSPSGEKIGALDDEMRKQAFESGEVAEPEVAGLLRRDRQEQEDWWKKVPRWQYRLATYLAGRWAAKEAATKAHPHLKLGFHDIHILTGAQLRDDYGSSGGQEPTRSDLAPMALIKGSQTDPNARDQTALVSISHDRDYATAVCIAYDPVMAAALEHLQNQSKNDKSS